SFAYQWQRCNAVGTSCAPVAGTTSSYSLSSADVGFTLVAVVTASNTAGSASAASPASAVVGSASTAGPPVTAGLQLWFEAGTETYADGQQVQTWHVKSGFGRDLSSSSTFDAAVFRATAVNGRAALEFNGANSVLKTYSTTFTLPQPTTFFVVYRSLDTDSAATRAFIFDTRNSLERQAFGRST